MDDEIGDASVVCSSSVQESPCPVVETVSRDIDSRIKVESDEEADKGEVMVEVVGSDVFVDGVGGSREGAVDSLEAGELKVNVWENQVLWRYGDDLSEDNKAQETVRPNVVEPDEVAEFVDFGSAEPAHSVAGEDSELPLNGIKDSKEGNSCIKNEEITIMQTSMEPVSEPFEEALGRNSVMDIQNETKDKKLNDPVDAESDPDCSVDLNLAVSVGHPAAPILGEEVLAAVIPNDDVSAPSLECQSTANDDDKDPGLKETDGVNDIERLVPEPNFIVSNAQDDNLVRVKDFHVLNSDATQEIHNIVRAGLESSQDISVGKNEQVGSLNFDSVLDFQDGDLGSKKREHMDPDLVTQWEPVFSNEPTQLDAEVGSSEPDADEGTRMEIQSDMEDNRNSTECSGHSSEEEILDEEDCREPKLECDENMHDAEMSMLLVEPLKFPGGVRINQSSYFPSPENEGQFSLSDLVWGKVRGYPWWPGQIFDPSDASEKAVKHFKKDSYLVGYFGDGTFAWNDYSVLKPFRPYFSQIEKQGNSESFHDAVNCALEEVSRRVELGLACSCIPKETYSQINCQVVENAGIHKELNQCKYVDQSCGATSFDPVEFLEYITELAPRASSAADRLEFVIARAQLSAFCSFNSYRRPTDLSSSGELLESIDGNLRTSDREIVSHKRKHIPKDSSPSRKERSLMELMGDGVYSPDYTDDSLSKDNSKPTSGKKKKIFDPLVEGLAKVSMPVNQSPKPSFKIGECIRRVATQLTGSAQHIRSHNDETVSDDFSKIHEQSDKQNMIVSSEYSLEEILSQLQLLAQDPKKKNPFLIKIISFVSGFRSSIILSRRNKKKRSASALGGSAEDFEFDDVNDSYWTDRIVQNYSEEQLLQNSENGTANLHVSPFNTEKVAKSGRKSHSRKRYSSKSFLNSASELDENIKQKKQDSSPAELILNFTEINHAPSEINLNKMFRRFGPLMESETQVDHSSGRAKVIFKRASDAEVAHSSAEKFNIFGSRQVHYEIGYSPLISVKILPLTVPLYLEDPAAMLEL